MCSFIPRLCSFEDIDAALQISKGTHYIMKLDISNNFKSGMEQKNIVIEQIEDLWL